MVHDPLEAPGGVAGVGGGQAVLLHVDRKHGELGRGQLTNVLHTFQPINNWEVNNVLGILGNPNEITFFL